MGAFDRYLHAQMQDRSFRRHYRWALFRIRLVDRWHNRGR